MEHASVPTLFEKAAHQDGAQIAVTNSIDICFVSSIFGEDMEYADKPSDVSTVWLDNDNDYYSSMFRSKKKNAKIETTFRFFLFTNLPDMAVSDGWTKIVKTDADLPYRRFITKSRWPKFMGWQDPQLQGCETIFYFDGHYQPNPARYGDFRSVAQSIQHFDGGLAQVPHPHKRTALQEFSRILFKHKDIPSNVEQSVLWLQAQPDFDNQCTLYQNAFFGYNPRNPQFRKAATFFWDQYSKEEDSWRDQPLWCYTLQHSNITPLLLKDEPHGLFGKDKQRTGHNDHQYDEHADGKMSSISTTSHSKASATGDSKR